MKRQDVATSSQQYLVETLSLLPSGFRDIGIPLGTILYILILSS